MTDYPAGTRARVTFVGTFNGSGHLEVEAPSSTKPSVWIWPEFAERVEVIEPDWQPGDIVLDADGEVYRRTNFDGPGLAWEGWMDFLDHSKPPRPLTLLARDGKPVPPPEQPQ